MFSGPDGRRALALTFDDGPSPHNTPRLLDLLGEHEVAATFFVVGDQITGNEALVRRMADEGHEIGNHTYSHPHTIRLKKAELLGELERANEAIAAANSDVHCARPPYGKDRRRFARVASELGLRSVLWSIDSGDTSGHPTARIISTVVGTATRGSVVLMHDGGDLRTRTLEACAVIVPELLAQGFEFVTVRDLLSQRTQQVTNRAPGAASSR